MAKYQYVGGVLQNITKLTKALNLIPDDVAKQLLTACLTESPKPPWDTGFLRNSGAVYRGVRLVATTESLGLTVGQYPGTTKRSKSSLRSQAVDGQLTMSKFNSSSRGDFELVTTNSDGGFKNFRSTITVVFHAPHAPIMHDGSYTAKAPDSGPGFVYEKLFSFAPEFALIAKRHMRI